MQSTGHSSMHALSSRSTHGSAMMYVTVVLFFNQRSGRVPPRRSKPSISPGRGSIVLGPQDVGHRVVVRRIVGIRGNRPLFTDVLGELISYDDAGLAVATRSGVQNIPLDAIQAAKRVPYGPKQITELERIANETWPAPVQEKLGGWTLRAADGWTGRANSALPLGDPGLGREAAIDAVVAWYRDRQLGPRFN